MALRVVGDPLTVVLVLGPGGEVVGQISLDLTVYGVENPIVEGELRPFVINCMDGLLLVVHTEGDTRAAYMKLPPGVIYKNKALTAAFRMPSAHINVRDYIAYMEELQRELLAKVGIPSIRTKKRIPENSN